MSTAKYLLYFNKNITLVLHFSRPLTFQKAFVKTMEKKFCKLFKNQLYYNTNGCFVCLSYEVYPCWLMLRHP